jgi:hypothetical protein
MRLRITALWATALTTIVTGTALTAVAVAPAGATTNPAITIRAIDRAGKVVPGQLSSALRIIRDTCASMLDLGTRCLTISIGTVRDGPFWVPRGDRESAGGRGGLGR